MGAGPRPYPVPAKRRRLPGHALQVARRNPRRSRARTESHQVRGCRAVVGLEHYIGQRALAHQQVAKQDMCVDAGRRLDTWHFCNVALYAVQVTLASRKQRRETVFRRLPWPTAHLAPALFSPSEHGAPRHPVKQGNTRLFLQRPDLLRHCRLCYERYLGCTRQVADAGDRDLVAKRVDLHFLSSH